MGRLRIISGSKRGHRIEVPRGAAIRPTGERVREAVFAVLGSVEGARTLDLFAGTGALGLEALSRGAAECTFVEKDPAVARVLKRNIESLGLDEKSEVLVWDYRRAVRALARREAPYDLLFVDPPYRMLADVSLWLRSALPDILAEHGLAVIEKARDARAELDLEIVLERPYGDTAIIVGKRV